MPVPAAALKRRWRKSVELVPSLKEFVGALTSAQREAIEDRAQRRIDAIEALRLEKFMLLAKNEEQREEAKARARLSTAAARRVVQAELEREHRRNATGRKLSLRAWAKGDEAGRAWLARKGLAAERRAA